MNKWLVPCNAKNIDIFEQLKTCNEICFKKNRALKTNDLVYIYLAKPYAEIKFRGIVKKDRVSLAEVGSYQKVPNNDKKAYISIEIDKAFAEGQLPYSELKEHGLRQVANQQRIQGTLEAYISSKEQGE